jgi:hypothetical protein
MKYNLVIFGFSGFVGKAFISKSKNILYVSSSIKYKSEVENYLYWDYKSELPKIETNYTLILCKFNSIKNAKKVFKEIHANVNTYKFVIYMSSSVVKMSKIYDDYARLKIAAEEFALKSFSRLLIIRPQVVLGSGGIWNQILSDICLSNFIWLPFAGRLKTSFINVDDLVLLVNNFVSNSTYRSINNLKNEYVKRRIFVSLRDYVLQNSQNHKKFFNLQPHRYSDSLTKNFLFSTLCSRLLPNFFAISTFNFFRQLFLFRKNIDLKKESSTFIPQGLLRFYLSEEYDDKKYFFTFINSK